MLLLETIIIQCSQTFKQERSIAAIFHLLKGKASIQTVQDSRTYRLTAFYGIYPQLDKRIFDQIVQQLINNDYLSLSSDQQTIYPTKQGIDWLNQMIVQLPLHHFNGFRFYKTDQQFYLRLLMMIQVLTNRQMNETSYIPIVDDPVVLHWVKQVYVTLRPNTKAYLQMIYTELTQFLRQIEDQFAQLFVDRLTAYQHYGMSFDQLSVTYDIKRTDVPLIFTATIHRLLKHVIHEKATYPFMTLLLDGLSIHGMMSQSATHTYELLKQNYSPEDIAQIRRLKMSTVYDHIVEIALFDERFPVHHFVNKEQQDEIISAVKAEQTFKLKTIKDHVSKEIDYFQIRLTLAATNIKLE